MKKKVVCVLIAMMVVVAQVSTVSAYHENKVVLNGGSAMVLSANETDIRPLYENLLVVQPSFAIIDGVASCALDVTCLDRDLKVKAAVILYKQTSAGKTVVDAWSLSGVGSITWHSDQKVPSGKYIMSVTVTSGPDRISEDITAVY